MGPQVSRGFCEEVPRVLTLFFEPITFLLPMWVWGVGCFVCVEHERTWNSCRECSIRESMTLCTTDFWDPLNQRMINPETHSKVARGLEHVHWHKRGQRQNEAHGEDELGLVGWATPRGCTYRLRRYVVIRYGTSEEQRLKWLGVPPLESILNLYRFASDET